MLTRTSFAFYDLFEKSIIAALDVRTQHNLMFYNVFLNLKTKKVINARNLAYGKDTFWFPILEKNIVGSDGDFFYGELTSKFMFELFLNFRQKDKITQSSTLNKYFSLSDVHSNPVITKFKIHNLN